MPFVVLWMNWPYRLFCFNAWSPVGGTVQEGLGNMVLLRRCVMGSEILGFQRFHLILVSLCLMVLSQDVSS